MDVIYIRIRWLCSNHPRVIQPVQALARILEIEALLQDLFIPEPIERIAHSPRREVCFLYNIFLCQQAAGFQDLVHQFCRRRQMFYLLYFKIELCFFYLCAINGKNDPSWFYTNSEIDLTIVKSFGTGKRTLSQFRGLSGPGAGNYRLIRERELYVSEFRSYCPFPRLLPSSCLRFSEAFLWAAFSLSGRGCGLVLAIVSPHRNVEIESFPHPWSQVGRPAGPWIASGLRQTANEDYTRIIIMLSKGANFVAYRKKPVKSV